MNYEIKTYQEGFIEDQFRIGSAIYDPWPMGGQTRPDQLRAAYQGEDFDPETRFYAFKEDEMVGFLTAAFKEEREGKRVFFFEPPYVLEEHAPEVEIMLLDHAIEALGSKGADILLTRAGPYWGKSLHYATKYGFEHTQDIVRGTKVDLNKVEASDFGDPDKFTPFNSEEHFEDVVALVAEQFNAPPEKVRPQLEIWKEFEEGGTTTSPWDHVLTLLAHRVFVDDEKVVARMFAMNHSNFGEDTINLSQAILAEGYDHLIGDILAAVVKAGKDNNKKYAVFHSGQWGSFPSDEPYEKLGLELDMKLAYFEKELN